MEQPRLYPARTVRRMFGDVSAMTLWRWERADILPAPQRINGRKYYDAGVVDALVKARQLPQAAA